MNNNLLAKTEDMYQYILICIYHSHKLENNPDGKMIISLYFNEIYSEFLKLFGNSQRFERIDVSELFKECLIYLMHKEDLKYDENIVLELYKSYILNSPLFSEKLFDYFKNVNLERFSQQSILNSSGQPAFDYYIYNQFKEMVKMTIGISSLSNNSLISNQLDRYIEQRYKIVLENSKKGGLSDFPPFLGSIIHGSDVTNVTRVNQFVNKYKSYIPLLYEDGVRMEDIIAWWNQPDFFKYYIYSEDELKMKFFVMHSLGINCNYFNIEEEFAKQSIKRKALIAERVVDFCMLNPVFKGFNFQHGWVNERILTGINKPLPYELKDRVLAYISKHGYSNLGRMLRDSRKSSMNAFIREKIQRMEI